MAEIQLTHIRIPAKVRPLRLALVSDLHKSDFTEVVDLLLTHVVPDAVLIAGDLFETPPRNRHYSCERGLSFLRRISHMLPIFYCPGNHDTTLPPNVVNELSHLGVHLLQDTSVIWEGLHIGGLTSCAYRKGKVPDLAFLEAFSREEGYKLLISHHPEYFPRYIAPLPIDLTVSGHAHGGQWQFFGRGIYSPGQGLFPRYTGGAYHEGRLVVTRGIGDSISIPRIHNPHEIVVLHLSPKEQE